MAWDNTPFAHFTKDSSAQSHTTMRDPARIDQVLAIVREVWHRYPDMRLGQLLINAIQPSNPCSELYSVEDTVLARKLESLAKRLSQAESAMEEKMRDPTDEEIAGRLIGIISDGFNRAIGALERARAIDTKKMRQHYTGIGSKYYDVVTEQIELTAKYGAPGVRQLFVETDKSPDS